MEQVHRLISDTKAKILNILSLLATELPPNFLTINMFPPVTDQSD